MARLSPILGADGRPIDKDQLFGEAKAGPTLTGVRSPISGHPADGLTPARLAAIHRAAASGDPLAYFELAEDMEERDLHYAAVLGTRKRQVSQIPITVEAATEDKEHERHADFVRAWLAEKVLANALFDMLDAIGKGFSIMEIEWSSTPEGVKPAKLNWRDPRWFGLDDISLDQPLLWEPGGKEPLAEHRYVVHRHKSKSGLTIRSGLARLVSWAWMYKAFTQRDWAIFVQNYGQPVRVGKYHPGATGEERDVLWQAVRNIAGDCAAIIPESMSIDFVEVKNAADGSKIYEGRAAWYNSEVSKAVLGQTATTDAAPGSHAAGKTHRLTQEDLERFDAGLVSTTVQQQLVERMVAFTFGPQEKYPVITIGRPDELPIEVIATVLDKLGPQGLEIEESQLLDRMGFTGPAASANGKPVRMVGGRRPAPAASPSDPNAKPQLSDKAELTLNSRLLGGLFDLQARQREPEYVERLTQALAQDAAGTLAGLTDAIRAEFDAATDLPDLMSRLDRLQLDPAELRDAMGRGMALAHLVGRAAVLDELKDGR